MLRCTMLLFLTSLLLSCSLLAADEVASSNAVIPVWPKSPPKWVAPEEQERDTTGPDGRQVAGKRVIRLGFVSTPELHVFRPAEKAGDTAVLICPGGGYSILAWDLEGTEIAQWLNGLGVTAVVLKYRVPTRNTDPKWLPPVQDIQRSLSLMRSGGVPGLSAKRIGVLGFSAGGNASARAAAAAKRYYEPVDSHDQSSAKPDFAVLIYPAWLIKEDDPSQLIDELEISEKSPPMFFAHAVDDRVDCMSSVTMFAKLKEHGVPASLHVFASGGHGFGGRVAGKPTDAWPGLCESWMKNQGWVQR